MSVINLDAELLFAILNGKVSTAINRKLYRLFRNEGFEISPEQWTVLHYLWTKDGVTQQDLCTTTFKDKPSMTRLIDKLEKQQLVVRNDSQKDRRINMIHLTEKGRQLEKFTKKLVFDFMQDALSDLSDQEIEISQKVLHNIFIKVKNSLQD